MINWLRARQTVVILSTLSLLLILERIFLDFRYVAVEMEGAQDFMPFTAPYMAAAFVVVGGWIWALLAAEQGKRAAHLVLVVFNGLNLFFAISTMAVLCPMPCQTARPITDILVILQLVIGGAAILAAGAAWWSSRASLTASQRSQEGGEA